MLALTGGTLVALAVAFARPEVPEPRTIEVRLADVPSEQPLFVRPFDMGFSPTGQPYGIWLVRDAEAPEGILALWSAETYHPRRCAIRLLEPDERALGNDWFMGGGLRDPCPSARYARDGGALFIAPRGMDRFDLEVVEGIVRIDLSRLRVGDCSPHVEFRSRCPYSMPDRPVYRRMHWPEA